MNTINKAVHSTHRKCSPIPAVLMVVLVHCTSTIPTSSTVFVQVASLRAELAEARKAVQDGHGFGVEQVRTKGSTSWPPGMS